MSKPRTPRLRSTQEIFDDLRTLCHQAGFLHAISKILARDMFIAVGKDGVSSPGGEDRRYSRSRLNQNEIMLLVGLLIQSTSDEVFMQIADTDSLVARADALLEELHQALEEPMRRTLIGIAEGKESSLPEGDFAKEAIFYAAQGPFVSQYKRFARERYRQDSDWLLRNYGISIRSMLEIAEAISNQVDNQMSALYAFARQQREPPSPQDISSSLLVSKESLTQQFGEKANRFLDLFTTPINGSNAAYDSPFAFNEVNARPLIDLGEHIYLSNSYRLFESIYESPFYWMLRDLNYKDVASANRGEFLEATISHLLEPTFGRQNVFRNAVIMRNKGEIAAEADVLVVFGEFIVIIQSKSKRLTLSARGGDLTALRKDFRVGVQEAYEQAIRFADLLMSGVEFQTKGNKPRRFDFLARAFPVVVLSDHFPSLTILITDLIEAPDGRFPAVIDIFFLDVLLRVVPDPVEVLYYLQQRLRFFEKLHGYSELNFLGFHLKQKLYVEDDIDRMLIEQDFSGDIEDYHFGLEARKPTNITFQKLEERIGVLRIAELISFLKSGPPELAGAIIELLDFSSDSLNNIAAVMDEVRAEVLAGKPFKAFSVETHFGGLSFVATSENNERVLQMAEMVGRRHKYKFKKDRWYVLIDYVGSDSLIDAALPLWEKWEQSDEMEEALKDLDQVLKTSFTSFKNNKSSSKCG